MGIDLTSYGASSPNR
jgi:hypothetical protein